MEEECQSSEEIYKELGEELPDFEKITEDFDIEKIFEKESSFLLRDIRHAIVEKITAYSQMFETFINPNNHPLFILTLLRGNTKEDREKIQTIYEALGKMQIASIKLDTIYKEEKEIEFINKTFKAWQPLKKEIYELVEKLEKEKIPEISKNDNGYFG